MGRARPGVRGLAIALLLAPALALAADPATGNSISLKVGEKIDYTPGFLPAQVICDDLSIVAVDAGEDRFYVTGKKAGSTLCGFTALASRGQRRVVTITVK